MDERNFVTSVALADGSELNFYFSPDPRVCLPISCMFRLLPNLLPIDCKETEHKILCRSELCSQLITSHIDIPAGYLISIFGKNADAYWTFGTAFFTCRKVYLYLDGTILYDDDMNALEAFKQYIQNRLEMFLINKM